MGHYVAEPHAMIAQFAEYAAVQMDMGWPYKLGCLMDGEGGHGSLRSVGGKKGEAAESTPQRENMGGSVDPSRPCCRRKWPRLHGIQC